MTASIEHLVRPFQTGDTTPAQKAPESQVQAVKNVIINPGRSGSLKTFSGSYSLTITYYVPNHPKEKARDPNSSYYANQYG